MVLRSTERCEMRRTMIRPFKMYLAVGRQAQSPVASSNSLQQGGAPLGSRACSPCPTGWLVGLDNNYIERSARQPVAVLWAFCGDRWALAARRRSPKYAWAAIFLMVRSPRSQRQSARWARKSMRPRGGVGKLVELEVTASSHRRLAVLHHQYCTLQRT